MLGWSPCGKVFLCLPLDRQTDRHVEPPSSRDLLLLHHLSSIIPEESPPSHARTLAHAHTHAPWWPSHNGSMAASCLPACLPFTQRWRSLGVVEITSTDWIRPALWITRTRRFIYTVVLLHSGRPFIAAQSNPTLTPSSSALSILDSVLARRRGGGGRVASCRIRNR